jgi:hypothetical protein
MTSKLTFLLCFFIALSSQAISQDTLKTFNNRWSTELNINPLNGSFSLNNANGQIKIRKFNQNSTAFRLALTIGYKQDVSKRNDPYGTIATNESISSKTSTILLNIGKEKHFSGSRRISPYIGFEAGLGLKLSRETTKTTTNERTVKGAWEQIVGGYPSYRIFAERGFWSAGLNAITGIDFYITKGFYAGCELAFGIDYIRYSNIKIEDPAEQSNYPDLVDYGWKIGPKLVNGIRIGYVF